MKKYIGSKGVRNPKIPFSESLLHSSCRMCPIPRWLVEGQDQGCCSNGPKSLPGVVWHMWLCCTSVCPPGDWYHWANKKEVPGWEVAMSSPLSRAVKEGEYFYRSHSGLWLFLTPRTCRRIIFWPQNHTAPSTGVNIAVHNTRSNLWIVGAHVLIIKNLYLLSLVGGHIFCYT